jgi:thiazole synthase
MSTVICVKRASGDVPSGWKVTDLVDSLGYTGKRIAVEVNGQIVPKGATPTGLSGQDRVEIVVAVEEASHGQHGTNFSTTGPLDTPFVLGGQVFGSRLLVGTGKYRDFAQTRDAIDASGAEIVTVAIRRVNIGQDPSAPSLLDAPTASHPAAQQRRLLHRRGRRAHPAPRPRAARRPRSRQAGSAGQPRRSSPTCPKPCGGRNPGARRLPGDGVLLRRSGAGADARSHRLRGDHAAGEPHRLGHGHPQPWNLRIIIDESRVPVIVDAGVGTASDAAIAMELGCDGVLMNTAIAAAGDPVRMALAMRQGVSAGRHAFLAGRMPRREYQGSPSSPVEGVIGQRPGRRVA